MYEYSSKLFPATVDSCVLIHVDSFAYITYVSTVNGQTIRKYQFATISITNCF